MVKKRFLPQKISAFVIVSFLCALLLSGCARTETAHQEVSPEEAAMAAYISLLSGERTLLDDDQLSMWWIPDFQDENMEYEYTCLDLDGDSVSELIVQMVNDPCSYNAVFHFENDRLICWNSDATEPGCRDYPLDDGTMVRQYDYNGTRSYTLFRYRSDGETQTLSSLFVRQELIPEDSPEPCPYYEINGEEVTETIFKEHLKEQVDDRMLERTAWTGI